MKKALLLLIALLVLPMLACGLGSDEHYTQSNEVNVDGSGNNVSIQIGQNSDMTQSNRYNGGGYGAGAGDDGEGAIMAFGMLALCFAGLLVFGGIVAAAGNIEFRT